MVPRELALDLHDLDLLAIQGGDDLGPPMIAEQREFFVQAHLVHIDRLRLTFILEHVPLIPAQAGIQR
jgi:hypothetical protein